MAYLAGALGVVGTIALSVAIFFGIVVGLPVWLHHRRRMAETMGTQQERMQEVLHRIKDLEKKCKSLEEQVLECQAQMADESRALDRKLADILPDQDDEHIKAGM